MNVRQHLVAALAQRLERLVEGAASVLVRAEPELLPLEVAVSLAEGAADRVVRLPLAEVLASDAWTAQVATNDCLLVEIARGDDPGQALLAASRATAEHGSAPVIIVAGSSDEPVGGDLASLFQVALGRDSLLVSDEDLIALGDDWTDVDRRDELLSVTYGVAALVVAGIEELESGDEDLSLAAEITRGTWVRMAAVPTGPLHTVAAAWAERVVPAVVDDDLALLRYLLPATSSRWLGIIASRALERDVTEAEAEATSAVPGILSPSVIATGAPPALVAEVIRLLLDEHPSRTATFRQRLVTCLSAPEEDPLDVDSLAPEIAMRALLKLKAWAALDEQVCRHAEVLTFLTTRERRELRATLPVEVPATWRWPRAVQEYVSYDELPWASSRSRGATSCGRRPSSGSRTSRPSRGPCGTASWRRSRSSRCPTSRTPSRSSRSS